MNPAITLYVIEVTGLTKQLDLLERAARYHRGLGADVVALEIGDDSQQFDDLAADMRFQVTIETDFQAVFLQLAAFFFRDSNLVFVSTGHEALEAAARLAGYKIIEVDEYVSVA